MSKTEAQYLNANHLRVDPSRVECMLNGMCLVEVDVNYDDVVIGDGVELKMSRNANGLHYDRVSHAARYGKVVVLPDDDEIEVPNEWTTFVDILEGDNVWFEGVEGIESDKWEYDGRLYYVLPYRSLIARKRGDDLVPLNGYILGDVVCDYSSIVSVEKQDKVRRVVVSNIGDKVFYDGSDMESDVSVGDELKLNTEHIPYLEDEMHMKLDRRLVYFHRKNIVAKKC